MNLRGTVSSTALLSAIAKFTRSAAKRLIKQWRQAQAATRALGARLARRRRREQTAQGPRHAALHNEQVRQTLGIGRRAAIARALAIGVGATAASSAVADRASAAPALPFGHVLQAGAVGDGITHNHDALVRFDNDGGGFYLANSVAPSTFYVEATLTLAHRAIIAPGAVIKPASGVTVTFTELLVLDELTQCFDVSAGGSIVLPTGFVPTPHMFGVDKTGATDSSAGVNAAIAASTSTGEIYFPASALKFSVVTTANIPHYFHGAGENSVCIPLGATQPCFIIRRNANLRKVRIEFMTFQDAGTQTSCGIWNTWSLFETRGLLFLSLKYGMVFNSCEWSKHADNTFAACAYWAYITCDYNTGTYDPLGIKSITYGAGAAQNPSEHTFTNWWGQAAAPGVGAVSVYQEDGDAAFGDRGTTKLIFEGLTKFFDRQSLIVASSGNALNGPGAVTIARAWFEGATGAETGMTIAGVTYPNNAIYVSGCSLTIGGDTYGLIAGSPNKTPIYVKYGPTSDLSAPPSLTVQDCMLSGNPFIIDKGVFSTIRNCVINGQAGGDLSNFTWAQNIIPVRGDVSGGTGAVTASTPPLVVGQAAVTVVGNPTIAAGGSGYVVGERPVLTNGVVLRVLAVSSGAITSAMVESATATSTVSNPVPVASTSGSGTGATFTLTYTPGASAHANIWNYGTGQVATPSGSGVANCSSMSIVSGAGTSGKMLALTMAATNGFFGAGNVSLTAGQALLISCGLMNMGSSDATLTFHGLGGFPGTVVTVPADGDLHHYSFVVYVGTTANTFPGIHNFSSSAAQLQLEYGQIIVFSPPTTAAAGDGALAKAVKFAGEGKYFYPAAW